MGTATPGRLAHLLRWTGLSLVVILFVQLLPLLGLWDWSDQSYRQLLIDRLVNQSPMALVGLLLMLFGTRLDFPNRRRTPLAWSAGVLAILLAIANVAALPFTVGVDQALVGPLDEQLSAREAQLSMARAQLNNTLALDQLAEQAVQAGRIPSSASAEQKRNLVRQLMEGQLQQAQTQLNQQRRGRDIAVNQRRFGGSGSAVILAVAFVLVALAALV